MNNRLLSDDDEGTSFPSSQPEMKKEESIVEHKPCQEELKSENGIEVVSPSGGSSDGVAENEYLSPSPKNEPSPEKDSDELTTASQEIDELPGQSVSESEMSEAFSNEFESIDTEEADDIKTDVSTELKLLKNKLCRGSPMIVLERLAGDVFDGNKLETPEP